VAEKPAPVPAWPADAVERRAVAALVPYARNARTHSPEQVAQIAASIVEFGWTMPVLVDEAGGIIAGHGRILAAQSLGITDAPVMVAREWSEAKRRLYVIADNKLALNARWDDALLALEFGDLRDMGADTGLTGFADGEVAELFGKAAAKAGLTDLDETPEAPADPVSRLGDVWLLGRHRITCGDCTDAAVVERVLAGAKPHLMVTDPPYGVEYDPKWRAQAGVNRNTGKLGEVLNDDRADWREAWALFPGDVAYVWHAGLFAGVVGESLTASGFGLRSQIIWAKERFALSRGDYHWQHEPAWYAVRTGSKGHYGGGRSQSTLWPIKAREDGGVGHGTQKPVECMKRPIENNSKAGDAVYEPFSGSGTTIIAAEMTGRRCYAIELSPAYVDVAVKRWEAFTGETATLEGDGRTFAEIAANGQRP
jgi:DNA modification methylase